MAKLRLLPQSTMAFLALKLLPLGLQVMSKDSLLHAVSAPLRVASFVDLSSGFCNMQIVFIAFCEIGPS